MKRVLARLWHRYRAWRYLRGRWTQEEVDDINRRANERYERMKRLIDE